MPLRFLHILFAFLLITAVCAFHSHTLGSPFLFDDDGNIVRNYYVRMEKLSWDTLVHAWNGPHLNSTRKISYLSFALNHVWGGNDVFGYHLVNIAIHIICGLLVALFFSQTLETGWLKERYGQTASVLSWGAALVWVLHPIQINAVTYIVQRMTSLAVLFALVSVTSWLAGRKRWHEGRHCQAVAFWFFGLTAWIMGMLSKEHVAVVPLLILAHDFFLFGKGEFSERKRQWLMVAGIIILTAVFYFLGSSPWRPILAGYEKRDFGLYERLLTQARVLWHYISLFYIPISERFCLLCEYPVSRGLFSPIFTAISLLSWIGVISASWIYRKRYPVFAWMVAWFLISHLVESTIIPLEIIFEHRMYLPSIGLALASMLLISESRYFREPVFRKIILCSVLIVLGTGTYIRNMDFADEITLYRAELRKYPNSEKIRMNLALALNDAGNIAEGGGILAEMVKAHPDDINILQSRYDFLIRVRNDAKEAEPVYRHIEELVAQDKYHPYKDAISMQLLADFFFEQGEYEKSLFFVEKLLRTFRSHKTLWLLKGLCHAKLGDWHGARQSFGEAWKKYPTDAFVSYWYGNSLIRTGEHDKGCEMAGKACRDGRAHLPAQLCRTLSKEYCSQGN